MCLTFVKSEDISIRDEEELDEVFIAAFSSRPIAEGWIAEHYQSLRDEVVYKDCIIYE